MLMIAGLAAEASAAISIVNSGSIAAVSDGTNPPDGENVATGKVTATLFDGYSSITTLYTTSGDSANFSGSFDILRGGALNSMGLGQIDVRFVATVNETYQLSGSFTNSAGAEGLSSFLEVVDTGQFAFLNTQFSSSAAKFNLGETAGSSNVFQGSLTGTLLAGVTYQWQAKVSSEPSPTDSGATASGSVSLDIAPAASPLSSTTTPEPSSLIVWTLIGLSIGGAGWWRRRKLAT
jgi:hypothetical protein